MDQVLSLTPEQVMLLQNSTSEIIRMENGGSDTKKTELIDKAKQDIMASRISKLKTQGKQKVSLEDVMGKLALRS